jgi:hypothetical protein
MKLYERCAYGIDLALRLNFVWTKNGLGWTFGFDVA